MEQVKAEPSMEASEAAALESAATPRLVLGARRTGMSLEAWRSSAIVLGSSPVVPTNSADRCLSAMCRARA